ncbi:MAG: DMT(drug/metabolite transporter) superfamily permease [Bacillota bacterium]|jgi:drug/metabolite transporter (DMT)-like permease|nr:DMT(drug/metabolite transporter) superfamily permease [Bacillota bacterium]
MKQFTGSICLFFAFTLAGTGVVSARHLSGKLGIFTITAISLFFALVFLLPFCGKTLLSSLSRLTWPGRFLLFIQAFFGMFLFRMFLLLGLLHTSAGEAGLLTGATPAITAILAALFLKEKINSWKAAGMICTVAGILLIQGLMTSNADFSQAHFSGNLLVLCAACCESAFNILSRSFVKKSDAAEGIGLSPMEQTAAVSAATMFLCLIPSALEHPAQQLSALIPSDWLALLWYGIFVTVLAFICWYAGIRRSSAITAAAFSGMMPFTSLFLSVLLLGEQAGLRQWSGGLLVIAGIFLIASKQNQDGADVQIMETES